MKDKQHKTVEYKCPTCEKCRLYIDGPYVGSCVYGGPYKGYINVEQESPIQS